ncbi:MAG: hypothetical protein FJ178_00860 [Gammaproteobacteria bacterium]|nr:hypothetical protein [Gammaproteobacteria bacterium]
MSSPEQFVLMVNAVILICAYFVIYPRFAGSDQNRLAINDLIANACALLVVGLNFWGSGERFDLLITEVGWFGFTVVTFLLMELPLFVWYARRHQLFRSNDE